MDTSKSRALAGVQYKNGYRKIVNEIPHDFRDKEFPGIVDYAKKNNKNFQKEYRRHFVVR